MARPSPILYSVAGLAAAILVGCPPPPRRPPLEMEPIGTVANVPRDEPEPATAGTTTSPNGATPPGASACTGSEFEALAEVLRQCDAPMPKSSELPAGIKDKLEVRVSTSTHQTSPGGRVDLTVVLRNKSNEALPLYFTGDPSPRFDIETLDAKGRRADLPGGKPPAWPKGTGPKVRDVKASKVVLEKAGTAKIKLAWDAVKLKWAPEKAREWEGRGYPRAPAGGLPAGRYTLLVKLPFVSEIDVPKVPVEVGGS